MPFVRAVPTLLTLGYTSPRKSLITTRRALVTDLPRSNFWPVLVDCSILHLIPQRLRDGVDKIEHGTIYWGANLELKQGTPERADDVACRLCSYG